MLIKGERAGAQRGRERISCLKFFLFCLKSNFFFISIDQQDLHTHCRPLSSLSIPPSPRNTLKAHTHFILPFLFSIFWPTLSGMWDLRSLTRDRTYTPCSGSMESKPLNRPRSPVSFYFVSVFTIIYLSVLGLHRSASCGEQGLFSSCSWSVFH